MEPLEIIQVDENNRLVVVYDDIAESPEEWTSVEFYDIDDYRIWRGWETPQEGTVAYAACVAQYMVRGKRWTKDQRDRAIHIFKLFAGDDREFKIHDWRGYSRSDWATVLEIGEDIGEYVTYAAWRRGDVYGVIHEKRQTWEHSEDDRELETWEHEDSLWGCYLDQEYTALVVASEHFDVEIKEKHNA